MSHHVIIDGNNLLHAVREHPAATNVGRETLARAVDRWALHHGNPVTVVFDGGTPAPGLIRQMSTERVTVRFSGAETADDVIIRMVEHAARPTAIRIVSSDGVIRHAARHRRCVSTDSAAFVGELLNTGKDRPTPDAVTPQPPGKPAFGNASSWFDAFGIEIDDEPFDGYGAMIGE